jgi:hypothetical protein
MGCPHFQQPELFEYVVKQGMAPMGSIGSPGGERDRTRGHRGCRGPRLENRERLGVAPAIVCASGRFSAGRCHSVFAKGRIILRICGSDTRPDRQDMTEIADCAVSAIKGQGLWKDRQDWTDLWDPDGTIPGN